MPTYLDKKAAFVLIIEPNVGLLLKIKPIQILASSYKLDQNTAKDQ